MGTEIAQEPVIKNRRHGKLFFPHRKEFAKPLGSLARYQLGLALIDQYRLSPKYMHADRRNSNSPIITNGIGRLGHE